jgi:hypothetical protein
MRHQLLGRSGLRVSKRFLYAMTTKPEVKRLPGRSDFGRGDLGSVAAAAIDSCGRPIDR